MGNPLCLILDVYVAVIYARIILSFVFLFKRLTAFASGLAYGLEGRVQRLAPRVYLITPANVEVSAEERRRLMERGFFDEF